MPIPSIELIERANRYFAEYADQNFVVQPSFPILYFGNMDRYCQSRLKVVTVGKNPSNNEFRLNNEDPYSFVRFPLWNPVVNNLHEALNGYFQNVPLTNWFSSFEPILNGMGCSYYEGIRENIAVHTDICSPIATYPTWSDLTAENQAMLFEEGFEIWRCLIEELRPDIMLVSIPRKLFQIIIGDDAGEDLIEFTHKKNGDIRKKPYVVSRHLLKLEIDHEIDVIFGKAANKPFDTISNVQKQEVGRICLR